MAREGQKMPAPPVRIVHPRQHRDPRQPGQTRELFVKRGQQDLGQPLGPVKGHGPRLGRRGAGAKRPTQPVERLGRQEHGRGRDTDIEAKTQPRRRQFPRNDPARQRGIGRGRIGEGRQTLLPVEGHGECALLQPEDRRADGAAVAFIRQKQVKLRIRQPFVEAQPRRVVLRRGLHQRVGLIERGLVSHRTARPLAAGARRAEDRPRTMGFSSAMPYCARTGEARGR